MDDKLAPQVKLTDNLRRLWQKWGKLLLKVIAFIYAALALLILEIILISPITYYPPHLDADKTFEKEIAVDIGFSQGAGGVAVLTQELITRIARLRPNWHFTLAIHTKTIKTYREFNAFPNISIVPVTYRRYNGIYTVCNLATFGLFSKSLAQLINFGNLFISPRCSLVWSAVSISLSPSLMEVFKQIPFVCLIHDTFWAEPSLSFPETVYPSPLREAILQTYTKNWMTRVCSKASRILTVSQFTKQQLLKFKNTKPQKVTVIPIRLSSRLPLAAPADHKAILNKYQLKPKQYVIFTSNWYKNKNHGRLLRAFKNFYTEQLAQGKAYKLVLTGNLCAYKFAAPEALALLGLVDQVVLAGHVPAKELSVLMQNAQFFVHPSVYEGFGMPLVEAMAAKLPIASSNCASLPEVAGDAAIYFDPYDPSDIARAMTQLADDASLREKLIQNGQKRLEQFSDTEAMVNTYLKIFEECMRSPSPQIANP